MSIPNQNFKLYYITIVEFSEFAEYWAFSDTGQNTNEKAEMTDAGLQTEQLTVSPTTEYEVIAFTSVGLVSSHCSSLLNTVYSNQKRPKWFLFKQCYSEHSHNIWTEICNRLYWIFQPKCIKLLYFISWNINSFIYVKRDKDWEVFRRLLKIMSWLALWLVIKSINKDEIIKI